MRANFLAMTAMGCAVWGGAGGPWWQESALSGAEAAELVALLSRLKPRPPKIRAKTPLEATPARALARAEDRAKASLAKSRGRSQKWLSHWSDGTREAKVSHERLASYRRRLPGGAGDTGGEIFCAARGSTTSERR